MGDVKNLRQLREEHGWTMREAAEHLPISHSTVGRNERKGYVKPEHRDAYADAFGVSRGLIDELCGDEGRPTRKVGSDASLLRWTRAASTSDMHPYARMMLLVFPVFIDRDDWIASLTKDALKERAHLSSDEVERHWPEVMESPLVERVGVGKYSFRLMLPTDTN